MAHNPMEQVKGLGRDYIKGYADRRDGTINLNLSKRDIIALINRLKSAEFDPFTDRVLDLLNRLTEQA